MTRSREQAARSTPGGDIAAARDFGVDLSLLVERLRRTPEERLLDLQAVMEFQEQIRGAARLAHDPPERDPAAAGRG